MGSNTTFTGKLYLAGYFLSFIGFVVPANSVTIGAQVHTQYLLTSYGGWVVLAIIVFLFAIQCAALIRNNKWLSWTAFIAGIYCFAYSIIQIAKAYEQISSSMADSLVNKLHPKVNTLPGLWLLAAGGALLLATAIQEIIKKNRASLPVPSTES